MREMVFIAYIVSLRIAEMDIRPVVVCPKREEREFWEEFWEECYMDLACLPLGTQYKRWNCETHLLWSRWSY
jgi:hypothetical protein